MVALIAVLGQQLGDDGIESAGHGRVKAADRGRIFHQQGGKHPGGAAVAKGWPSGRHLIEHATQAEEVSAVIERVALGLLRGHVRSGAESRAGSGETAAAGGGGGVVLCVKEAGIQRSLSALLLGHSEIENLELLAITAALHHEEVGRLDIAMDDAPGVGGASALAACCPRLMTSEGERR